MYNFFLFNVLIVLLEQLTGDLIVFTQYCYVYDTCSDWLKVNNDNNGKVECFQKVNIDLSSLEGVDVEKKNPHIWINYQLAKVKVTIAHSNADSVNSKLTSGLSMTQRQCTSASSLVYI